MPRVAPQFNGQPCAIEHRITFGDYERRELRKFQESYRFDKFAENLMQIIAAGLVGGGIYLGFKYGGAAIGAGLDVTKEAGEFITDVYTDVNNAIRGLNPDGTESTVEGSNIDGEPVDIPVPLSGTVAGGVSKKIVELGVWLPNPLTGEVPGTIPWFYRNRPWA